MKVISEIKNELFNRNELIMSLESEKTPSFDEVRSKISEVAKKPEENINVYNIKGSFGSKVFEVYAYIYDSKEDLEKAVQKTKKQRDEEKKVSDEAFKAAKEGKEAPAEASAETSAAPVAEAPVEEKKEEVVEEAVEEAVEEKAVEEAVEEVASSAEPESPVETSALAEEKTAE